MKNYKKYIILWLSQSVSQLGSAMLSFALTLWAYEQSRSAMTVSLMIFSGNLPFVIVSFFAGTLVDRYSKKAVMLISDSIAALCTVSVMLLTSFGELHILHIYIVNAVVGFTNAFQQPASAAAIGRLVPKEKLSNVSGMNSFSSNLVSVLSPVIAAALYSAGRLPIILLIDISTFIFAFLTLLIFISVPEEYKAAKKSTLAADTAEGFRFLKKEKGLLYLMLTMSVTMFFTMLTYENTLSPMILARSGSNLTLGIVNAVIGIGGIVGGIIVSVKSKTKNCLMMIYFSAAVSFLFGDVLMAVGRNAVMWSIAGLAASLPIPFVTAGQNVIMYERVPKDMQGRVFAVSNAIRSGSVPVGLLLGGFLADNVLEPFMQSGSAASNALSVLVGSGEGSGMAVVFLFTGTIGFFVSILSYRNKEIRKLI